ncbi:ketoacyl-ACP synthase III family protein [Streptomyces sp. NPDC050560]|uniref:ketoacyl-ACP synthase III family protein n=1 Tax=Streptomyces sp. NPDC050560 TaxID=3365630 RepID=UPI0037ABBD2F
MRLTRQLSLLAGAWLPPDRDTADLAVASGRLSAATARDLGYTELPVSAGTAPPGMAVRAARALLDRGGVPAEALSLLLHASVHHQGHDAWSAPHHIADRLGAHRATPVGVLQQCNGGAVGIELAAARLQGDPAAGPALVTTADRFLLPSWDRWLTDYGMAAGDGATAVLVHHHRGLPADLLLHAVHTEAASELEVMHRGDDELDAAPLGHGSMIDVRRTKRAFVREFGIERFTKTAHDRIRAVVARALADAGLAPDDPRLRYAVLPRLGAKAMREAYVPPLVESTPAELLDLGRESGHLGAGDLNASLADLVSRHLLEPGEHALVLNGGGGFTFTAVVVAAPTTR